MRKKNHRYKETQDKLENSKLSLIVLTYYAVAAKWHGKTIEEPKLVYAETTSVSSGDFWKITNHQEATINWNMVKSHPFAEAVEGILETLAHLFCDLSFKKKICAATVALF